MSNKYPMDLYFATCMSLLGSLQFGYHLGVLNTCLDVVVDDLNAASRGPIIVSAVLIGATLGSLCSGTLADLYGPKRATIYNTIPFILGTTLSATASSVSTMMFGRFLTGIAAGAASLLTPRYLSEIAPSSIRGFLGTLHQIIINFGIVVAFAVGLPYQHPNPDVTVFGVDMSWWRFMFWLGAVPSAVQAVGMSLCPETPVWLLFSGLNAEAIKSYKRLHGNDLQLDALQHRHEDGEHGSGAIESGVLSSNATDHHASSQPLLPDGANSNNPSTDLAGHAGHTGGFSALLAPKYRRVMILAATLPLLQQLSGINSVVLYGSDVFKRAGVSSPIIANLLLGIDNTLSTVVAAVLMDKAGRKPLLTWSYGGMGACLLGMAAFLVLPFPESLGGTVSFLSILCYIFFFALGSGPITWLYLPEILPPEIKGPAQSSVTAINWLSNFIIGMYFPQMMATFGFSGAYTIFGLACAVGAVFCHKEMVETKQRSLDSIQAELLR